MEGGTHLWACLRYIDLNMVRTGALGHPCEWAWTGWGELVGARKRNRLIALRALLTLLEEADQERFRANYKADLERHVAAGQNIRDASWAEAVAVGSPAFVERVRAELLSDYSRRRLTAEPDEQSDRMVLRELPSAYGTENRPEKRSIGHFGGVETQ